ncbi:uncharacterized protein EI97DRAFT_432700 [Westerdykella ornata]|uniref:DUF3128 domain-containing protein n=1 Tax=Westerdykella ornata TaxID=318751 RepID=A0A6A6JLF3_WESOR|nr:uncharacterized protein EI97DRAFT_432700 [Westerdykella ornata]KAF2277084.1 hypothetical protein EI97DRAFT_432700 [Westerdykella ornata]
MGWLWSSKTPADTASPSTSPTTQPTPPSIPQSTEFKTATTSDRDFQAAFPHLAPTSSTSSTTTTASTPQSSSSSSPSSSTTTTTTTETSSSDDDYPTTMSCRAAFDSAFYCASLGGHFNDIYRYGELRSCSEHWADWRFCMGLKTRTKADKEALIRERYRMKEEKLRSGPNSERVWERRERGERYFGAFKPPA